jgi:diacylglycerol kinase (ATP)
MRAALILNPAARASDHSPEEILSTLARSGVEAVLVPIEEGIEAALCAALSAHSDAVIVGGGDGTLSTAAGVLCGHAVPLGILPLGTANDFARTTGIPRDLEQACAIIGAGHTVAVDVGVANGRHFLNVASIGLPATLSSVLSDELKRRWGVLAYPLAAVRAALRQRPFTATLTIDGRRRRVRRVMQVAVGSGRYYGGGMRVTDAAKATDGYLHIHVITAPNVGALLWTLRHLRSGRYALGDSALRFQAQHVRITTRRRLPVNVDGELHGHTPLEVAVRPRCLPVFAPGSTE